MTLCSVPDCDGSPWALGLCKRHYNRQHTYGDLNLDTNERSAWPEPAPPAKPAVVLPRRILRPYCKCGMAVGHWLGCSEVAA